MRRDKTTVRCKITVIKKMKNNLFPLWLSPVLMGAGTVLVYASNVTISYTPPNASLNTLLTGELVVPAQIPIPGAETIKLLGLGSIGLGLARLGGYAFGKQSESQEIAQLPPWTEARVVTPIYSMTQPRESDRPAVMEEPITPTVYPVQSPEPQPLSTATTESETIALAQPSAPATAPSVAEPTLAIDQTPESPSNSPVPTAETPAPSESFAVIPQAPATRETDLETDAVTLDEDTAVVTPTEPDDSSATGQTANPLGVVNRIVEVVTNSSMPQHVAIAGIPRGGKSYTLRGIIWGIKQVEPDAIIRIVDPKNSPVGWLGLEKIPGCVRLSHHGLQLALETIDEAIALLDRAIDTRDTHHRAYFIFDDWSGMLAEAKRLDAKTAATEPHGSNIYPDLLYNMERLALKGLEYGIHLILATHSWDCVEFGFDAQCRFAFAVAALGRQGRWEALSSLLKSDIVIPDDEVRERLAQQKNEAIEKVRDRECPVMVLAGEGGVLDALPDFEWLDWVDLSVFADKRTPDNDALHRNGTASKSMAQIA
jgi:hypothetical protein